MKNGSQNTIYISQIIITIVSMIMMVSLFSLRAEMAAPAIFDLRFNVYALISLFSAAINAVFLVYIVKAKIRGDEASWFYLFILALLFYSLFEALQRLSGNPEGAIFWSRLLGIVTLVPVAAFLFILNYLHPTLKKVWITPVLLTSAVVLFFFHVNGGVLFDVGATGIKEYPWGYNAELENGFLFHEIWVITIVIASLYIFATFIRNTTNPLLKKQAKLFLLAFSFPLVGGLSTEVLIPIFNEGHAIVVPLTAAFTTMTAGTMLWGLKRYRAFEVSPAMLSEEILALMNESVIVVDKDLRIEFVNQETEEAFASAGGKLEGAYATDFLDSASQKRLIDRLQHLKTGDTAFLDDIVIHLEGQDEIYGRLSISRMTEENGFEGFVIVISDVTELKQSYEALEREKANVEHTVQIRTEELRKAQAKLLEVDKLKTEFVILTSHHLRTPLTIVKGNLELLRLPGISEDKKQEIIENADTGAKKLGELVEQLLTISHIEAGGNYNRETIKSTELLSPLVDELAQLAAIKNNTLVTAIEVKDSAVEVNATRLRAGIRNILDNACKFTTDGTVSFKAQVTSKNLVVLIQDTGIGIAESEMSKLFTKFHRATDSMQYDYDGEGIGLYVAKLIIEDHSGTIDIKSVEGQGTTVTVTLPLAA